MTEQMLRLIKHDKGIGHILIKQRSMEFFDSDKTYPLPAGEDVCNIYNIDFDSFDMGLKVGDKWHFANNMYTSLSGITKKVLLYGDYVCNTKVIYDDDIVLNNEYAGFGWHFMDFRTKVTSKFDPHVFGNTNTTPNERYVEDDNDEAEKKDDEKK